MEEGVSGGLKSGGHYITVGTGEGLCSLGFGVDQVIILGNNFEKFVREEF